jgi:branched-chain amino acid transport system permease protein
MADRAAFPPLTTTPAIDLTRSLRLLQRLFTIMTVVFIIWSIGVSSSLITGIAQNIGGPAAVGAVRGAWVIFQIIVRAMVGLIVVGTLINLVVRRGAQDGYTVRALTGLFGTVVIWLIAERVYTVTNATPYILTLWGLQFANGLILGSLYALVALGYTLVYGILLMINFAHGEIMMIGGYFGYFALQLFRGDPYLFVPRGVPPEQASVIGTFLMMLFIVAIAMLASSFTGLAVERIAYRPLRKAPRLAPLISAIGMSIVLQQVVQRIFGPVQRSFDRPTILDGSLLVNMGPAFNNSRIPVSKIGIIIFIASLILMLALYVLVQRTKIGRAMRAVAEDKDTAALMGANVDRIIAVTFALGAALAGAAGIMWAFYTGQTDPFAGFRPGLKAFTSAVVGGIGNIPGAVFGGLFLGLVEALGPFALGIPNEYQDVIAFALLVLVLIFRPTGILGEILAEKKV